MQFCKLKYCFFLLVIASGLNKINAQKKYYIITNEKKRYLGFDMNPLIGAALPLAKLPTNNPYSLVLRKYWGNNGLRTGMGIFISDNSNESSFTYSIDYDNRRQLEKKLSMFQGFGTSLVLFSGSFDDIGNRNGNWFNGIGLYGHVGFEYALAPKISIATEGRLYLLATESGGRFKLSPPMNVMLHFDISK